MTFIMEIVRASELPKIWYSDFISLSHKIRHNITRYNATVSSTRNIVYYKANILYGACEKLDIQNISYLRYNEMQFHCFRRNSPFVFFLFVKINSRSSNATRTVIQLQWKEKREQDLTISFHVLFFLNCCLIFFISFCESKKGE